MSRQLSAPLLAAAVLIALSVAAACGGNGDGEGGGNLEITFDGTDCGFRGQETVSESNISVLVDNQAGTVVTLDVLRLEDGSFDDLAAHIEGVTGPDYLPSWASSIKATPAAAGEVTSFGMALTAGSYALVCVTEAPLGVQAVAPFTVAVES